ncbi:MAG: TonB-dependent siderophore receptor [Methylococcales bacterium]
MSRTDRYTLRVTVIALLIAFGAQPILAESDGVIHFDIPAQPLNRALLAFGKQSGRQLLYSTDIADNLTSGPLKGSYTADQAIRILLGDAPVEAVPANGKAITLKANERPAPSGSQAPAAQTALPKVTVSATAEYDANDPYNPDYNRPNAFTATKTDTPIMETPVNIQVVPQQVLKDQQVVRFDKALQNVSGVYFQPPDVGQAASIIRGFTVPDFYVNGVRQQPGFHQTTFRETANIEQIEVLKGPASILYGRLEPGGLINLVTKQPLLTPYYSLNQQFGSFDFYRTTLDATGPITKDDT